MNVLIFIDPISGSANYDKRASVARAWVRAIAKSVIHESVRVAICAPGREAAWCREVLGESSTVPILSSELAPTDFIQHLQLKVGGGAFNAGASGSDVSSGGSDSASNRRDYGRGEGAVAEALSRFFASIRSGPFAFDLICSTGESDAPAVAASKCGARFARIRHWPETGDRWRPFGFMEFRDARGREAKAGLTVEHLRKSSLLRLPASVDQRFQGPQLAVNPFEARFSRVTGAAAPAFAAGRKVALIALREEGSISDCARSAYPDDESVLQAVAPRLLGAGWRVLVMGSRKSRRRLSASWKSEAGLSFLPPTSSATTKKERRETLTLLSQVDLVVTDESNLGLEAAMFERPVCVLGHPFYKIPGIFPDLDAVLEQTLNPRAYWEDLALLRAFLLRCQGASITEFLSKKSFLQRLVEGAALNDRFADDPRGWIRELHRNWGLEAESACLLEIRNREAELEPVLD